MDFDHALLLFVLVVIVSRRVIDAWRVVDAVSKAATLEPGFKPRSAKLGSAGEIAVVIGNVMLVPRMFQ